MSINYQQLKTPEDGLIGLCITIVGVEDLKTFNELVQRGANLWPDAPPQMKVFADQVTNDGKIFQDYASQDTSPSRKN